MIIERPVLLQFRSFLLQWGGINKKRTAGRYIGKDGTIIDINLAEDKILKNLF